MSTEPISFNTEMNRMAALSCHPLAEQYRSLAMRLALTPGLTAESAVHLLQAAHVDSSRAPWRFGG